IENALAALPEKSVQRVLIRYARPWPDRRGARRDSVSGPVISTSGSAPPCRCSVFVTFTMAHAGAGSWSSVAVTFTVTGIIDPFGGQSTIGVAAAEAVGACASTTGVNR